jgi:hypothetical protein
MEHTKIRWGMIDCGNVAERKSGSAFYSLRLLLHGVGKKLLFDDLICYHNDAKKAHQGGLLKDRGKGRVKISTLRHPARRPTRHPTRHILYL